MKKIKIVTSIGVGLISLLIISFYRSDYIHFSGSINTDASGAFGALLSSIIAPFVLITTYYIFKEQQKSISKQTFDSTFINLINSFYNLLNTIQFLQAREGKDSLKEYADVFTLKYKASLKEQGENLTNSEKNNLAKNIYEELHRDFGHTFSQYFKYVLFVLETIDNQKNLSKLEQKTYIKNFKTHLNDSELLLIMFHSVTQGKLQMQMKNITH